MNRFNWDETLNRNDPAPFENDTGRSVPSMEPHSPVDRMVSHLAIPALAVLVAVVLFEPLFLDASMMSLDNRIIPPFCYHLDEGDLPRVMNIASCDINIWLMPETLLHLERLKAGELPLWNEHGHLGQPLLATLGFTPFYPASLLYLLLDPFRGYAVSMALHLFILGAGMWCFLRSRKLAPSASLLGAVSLSLCAFITVHMHIPQFVQVAAWFPWMMLAADRLIAQPGCRRSAVFGTVIGLCLLGGFPQLSLFSLLAVAVWFCVGLANQAPGIRIRITVFTTVAVVLGAMISCIQLLPASELLSESVRSEGWSSEMLKQKRFAPQSLAGLVLPRFFGPAVQEFTEDALAIKQVWDFPSVKAWQDTESQNGFEENAVFLGLIPLYLGLASFFRKWRWKEVFPRLLLATSMAFGMGALFFSDWCEQIPGLSTGSPKRVLFVFSFAVVWLAALEFDRLKKEETGFLLFSFGLMLIGLGSACFMPYERWFFPHASAEERLWFRETVTPDLIRAMVVGAILVVSALAVRLKRVRYALVLLLAGAAGELVLFARHLNPPQQLEKQYAATPVIDWLEERGAGEDSRLVPFCTAELLPASMSQVFGLRSCNGFVSLIDRQTSELLRAVEPGIFKPQSPGFTNAFTETESLQSPVLDMIGARYVPTGVLGYQQITDSQDPLPGIELAYMNMKECLAVFERKSALPPAYLVRHLKVIPDGEERLDYLVSADFDPASEAVVESAINDLAGPATDGGAPLSDDVRYARPSPERIEIEVNCEVPSFLVVSESHYPGWHAEVDGIAAPLHRTNHALMGIALPQGARNVVLSYHPVSFYLGLSLSLFGMLACAAFFLKR